MQHRTLVGQTLGQYRVLQLIGRGGMAEVYLAFHIALNQKRAIKVLAPHLAGDPKLIARFRREATTVASLNHPNIVPVYDFGEQDGLLYIVMPYLEGGSLTYQMPKPNDLPGIAGRIDEIAAALDYAHSRGVIHRDLKPANVLLNEDNRAQVADFGIARLLQASGSSATNNVLGTPEYMSPEQGRGVPVDGRSDIYALGVIAYEMVTGRVPFERDSGWAVILAHINEPPAPPSAVQALVPPAVEQVILRALAKDPAERFASAGEFAQAFRSALAQGVTLPPQPLAIASQITVSRPPAAPVTTTSIEDAELAGLFDSAVAASRAREWQRAREMLVEVVRRRPTGYERNGQRASALLAEAEHQSTLPQAGSKKSIWLQWVGGTFAGAAAFGLFLAVTIWFVATVVRYTPPDSVVTVAYIAFPATFLLFIGIAQSFLIGKWLGIRSGLLWAPASLLAWVIIVPFPYVGINAVVKDAGSSTSALFAVVVFGGLAVGLGQWLVLVSRVRQSGWWVPTNGIAWVFCFIFWLIGGILLQNAPVVSGLVQKQPVVSLFLSFVISLPTAGAVFGALTGLALVSMVQQRR